MTSTIWFSSGSNMVPFMKVLIEVSLVFIPKEGDAQTLTFWRSIIMLIVTYKIFAKTLQLKLQHILSNVISLGQKIFFSFQFYHGQYCHDPKIFTLGQSI